MGWILGATAVTIAKTPKPCCRLTRGLICELDSQGSASRTRGRRKRRKWGIAVGGDWYEKRHLSAAEERAQKTGLLWHCEIVPIGHDGDSLTVTRGDKKGGPGHAHPLLT
jgi:hypothetical protein